MLLAMFLFAAGDTLSKFLTSDFHPVQIIWFRQSGLFLGVMILLAVRGLSVLNSRRKHLQICRGVLVVISSLLFVFAVRYAPLADAVAASFVAPFFLTLFGALLLKEKVGVRRWSAVAVGFLGALVIIRPGLGAMHPAILLVVLAAAFFAARQVLGRFLSDSDNTATTVCYTAITASLVITVPLPFVWVSPETSLQWVLFAALAVFGAGGEILVIKSLELSEAATVAPMHYTIIIWATFYGYVVFGQLPDGWTLLGTTIIVMAGLYTLRRAASVS